MNEAAKVAGYLAAEVIGVLAAEGWLPVYLAFKTKGQYPLIQIVDEGHDHPANEWLAEDRLRDNPLNARCGVMVTLQYDWSEDDTEQLYTLSFALRDYTNPTARANIVVPFTPEESPQVPRNKPPRVVRRAARKHISSRRCDPQFRVHRPAIDLWVECESFEPSAILEAFARGVASNATGAKTWAALLDDSK